MFKGTMILALKVLVMFTLSIGTLTLESAIFIYSWMPPQMALVTGVVIFLVNISIIEKKYFDSIENLCKHKFNSKGI